MRCGIIVNAGDAREQVELAAAAEAAGWDGVFTYDAIAIGDDPLYDPWTLLAAMAVRTSRVRLGAIVFAPTRRRPWKLAREAITIDQLSGGRLILPVGLGALDDAGFGAVGEVTATPERAAILDETLAILDGLWSGEPFAFGGAHYRFPALTFRPRPIQRPRIPIWVVGAWPSERSMARTLRWDGAVLQVASSEEIAAAAAWLAAHGAGTPTTPRSDATFELVAQGHTPPDPEAAGAHVAPVAAAGATWWIEGDWRPERTLATVRQRVDSGPPRVS
ncbi:MAG TPA: LLM class flavin-dependent oxidoreductase [Candidatus Limnocylindrales bacterium]|nr:LLM class flavin-dependent oxidoreductase [Candidatus Limnocylindrales bacterium]